jgi:hypothetical protein
MNILEGARDLTDADRPIQTVLLSLGADDPLGVLVCGIAIVGQTEILRLRAGEGAYRRIRDKADGLGAVLAARLCSGFGPRRTMPQLEPHLIGIALGAFADPGVLSPQQSG